MRTAITIAKTHAGEWKLISTPAEDLLKQRKNFRELRAARVHKEFSIVQYQENDGAAETARLLTEEQAAAQETQRKKDHAAYLAGQNPKPATPGTAGAPPAPAKSAAEIRRDELLALQRDELLALIAKITPPIEAKGTKGALVAAILKSEGIELPVSETE